MPAWKMKNHLKSTWFQLWLYLIVASVWFILTDLLYELWIHHLSARYIFFSSLRAGCLFFFSLWILRNLIMRASRAEEHLTAFVQHHPDAILILTHQGRIMDANPKFNELFKLNPAQCCLGRLWTETPLIPKDKVQEATALVSAVAQGQEISGIRIKTQTPEGKQLEVSLSAFCLENVGIAVTLRDITNELLAEQQLVQSEKLAAIGQLAAGVAHEIRNPLTTLDGFLKILPTVSEMQQNDFIRIMLQEVKRISGIVTSMLTLAKPQSYELTEVPMEELIRGVCDLLIPEFLLRNAELLIEMSPATQGTMVYGHEDRLKQVLINLARNALDAIEDSPEKRVSLCLHMDAQQVVIRVKDTGNGMSAEQLERIFEPFYTTKGHGTGLGLHVCQQIVETHQGRLYFDSQPGYGTTAHISLPVLTPQGIPD